MSSKIIAVFVVLITALFSVFIVYSADQKIDQFYAAMPTVPNLETEDYATEKQEELIKRYVAMGHYANSVLETGRYVFYSLFSMLFFTCAMWLVLSSALAIMVLKNADKRRQLDIQTRT